MNNRFLPISRLIFLFWIAGAIGRAHAQSPLDSLPPVDSLSDLQVNRLTQQFAATARELEAQALERKSVAELRRIAADTLWAVAKADSTLAKQTVDSLAALLKTARSEEKSALKVWDQAQKALDLASKTEASDNVNQRKNLVKVWKSLRNLSAALQPAAPKPEPEKKEKAPKEKKRPKEKEKPAAEEVSVARDSVPAVVEEKKAAPKKEAPAGPRFRAYNPDLDVMLHPPGLPCRMAVVQRDEFSGEIYRRCANVELFRSSPPALRNFLQGKPNVLCEAALGASGSRYFLQLRFIIHDPSPRKSFGRLDKDSPLILALMDGSTITLNTGQASEGAPNPDTGAYIYETQFPLIAEEIKKLRRMELDKMRVAWSSGYEDYEVQYVQLLMGQARCLLEGN